MPAKNSIKDYVPNAFYHIFNRGVGKMDIFRKENDYIVFLYYLRIIFTPVNLLEQELVQLREKIDASENPQVAKVMRLTRAINQARRLELFKDVELLSFSLMPNHFHLLVFQKKKNGIEMLMRRLASAYSSHFIKEHHHDGSVYRGTYGGAHLYYEPELQALGTARYIEHNPIDLLYNNHGVKPRYAPKFSGIHDYPFSSLRYYLTKGQGTGKSPVWLNTKRLISIFRKIKEKPNGVMEAHVARYKSYADFILSQEDFDLEDIRLAHLEGLF